MQNCDNCSNDFNYCYESEVLKLCEPDHTSKVQLSDSLVALTLEKTEHRFPQGILLEYIIEAVPVRIPVLEFPCRQIIP